MNNIQSNIVNLFPTPVGIYTFPREFTQEELIFVRDLEKAKNIGNQKSTNFYVLNEPILAEVKEFLQSCTDEYFDRVYKPKEDIKLRITQSWCNYTEGMEFHHKHTHPNSFISGVFYFQTNDETDKIYFFEDSYKQFKIPAREFNNYNSDSWWLPSVTGQLLLFPSRMTHMVETRLETQYTRMSMSFNTFLVGKLGSGDELTELIL